MALTATFVEGEHSSYTKISGTLTLNGTTPVTQELDLRRPVKGGSVLGLVTGGTNTRVVSVRGYRTTDAPAFTEGESDYFDEDLTVGADNRAHGNWHPCEAMTSFNASSGIPAGKMTVDAVADGAETGTLTLEMLLWHN